MRLWIGIKMAIEMMKKYRSKLESKVHLLLGEEWEYESTKVSYIQRRNYTPDFVRGNTLIEVKGFFRTGDQAKYLAIRESLPKRKNLVFVFSNPQKPVRRGAKLTMSGWCDKHGFKCMGVNDLVKLKGKLR